MPPEPAKVRSEQEEDKRPMLLSFVMWQLQLVGAKQLPPLSWLASPASRSALSPPAALSLGPAPVQGKHRLLFLLYKQSGRVTVKPPSKRQGFQVGPLLRVACASRQVQRRNAPVFGEPLLLSCRSPAGRKCTGRPTR